MALLTPVEVTRADARRRARIARAYRNDIPFHAQGTSQQPSGTTEQPFGTSEQPTLFRKSFPL